MDIQIDKGVPLPAGGRKPKYPFLLLEVGDSFLFPDGTPRSSAKVAASNHGKRHGVKLAIRAEGDRLRCWRTA